MTEPTDEQVAAFKAAWERADWHRPRETRQPGDRTRAGLRAVFALSRPLPTQEEALLALADTTVWTVETWRTLVTLAQSGWRPPEIDGALTAGPQPYPPTGTNGGILPHAYRPPSGPWYSVLPAPCTVCGLGPNDVRHSYMVNS